MSNLFKPFIRASAFIRKEVFEIVRQPRMVITLILGPFLILFVFGIGYRNEPRALRTMFVAPAGSAMAVQIQQVAPTLGAQLIYMGVTPDMNQALNSWRKGDVDLVVVAPTNPYQTIRSNQQAVFTLYHREIDPVEVSYIDYFGQFYVDEVNREVMKNITAQGQADAAQLQNDLKTIKGTAAALHTSLQNGDTASASQQQQQLTSGIDAFSLAAGASLELLSNVQGLGAGGSQDGLPATGSVSDIQKSNQQLQSSNDTASKLQAVTQIQKDLDSLDAQLSEFRSISPVILVSPFNSETKTVAPVQPSATAFFAPAVLALLLQHMTLTFAALSIVRERTLGTMELFRVSPLSAAEALLGKYISYMIFSGIIALVLVMLLVYILKMPMLGDWLAFAGVVAAVLFTSLGIGFVISLISKTDSQAVQYSMIILLSSVFFSGLLLTLDMLTAPVRVISWLLPATYGTTLLRDIALRGAAPNMLYLGGLVAIGLALFILAWLMLRRAISRAEG